MILENKKFSYRKTATYGLVGCILLGSLLLSHPIKTFAATDEPTTATNAVTSNVFKGASYNESIVATKQISQRAQIVMPDGTTHDIVNDVPIQRIATGDETYPYLYRYELGEPVHSPLYGDVPVISGYTPNVYSIVPEIPTYNANNQYFKVTYAKTDTQTAVTKTDMTVRRIHLQFPDRDEIVTTQVAMHEYLKDGTEHTFTKDIYGYHVDASSDMSAFTLPTFEGYQLEGTMTIVPEIKTITKGTKDMDVYVKYTSVKDQKDVKYKVYEETPVTLKREVSFVNRKDATDVKTSAESIDALKVSLVRSYVNAEDDRVNDQVSTFAAYENDQFAFSKKALPVSLKDYRSAMKYHALIPLTGNDFTPQAAAVGYTEDATVLRAEPALLAMKDGSNVDPFVTFAKDNEPYNAAIVSKLDNLVTTPEAKGATLNVYDDDTQGLTTIALDQFDADVDVTTTDAFLAKFPKEQFEVLSTQSAIDNGKTVFTIHVRKAVDKAKIQVIDDTAKSEQTLTVDKFDSKADVATLADFLKAYPSDKYEVVSSDQTYANHLVSGTVHVKHKQVVKDGPSKTIKRTIQVNAPDGTTKNVDDEVTFQSKETLDAVTNERIGELQYDQSEIAFKAFELPTYEGYVPTPDTIEYKVAKPTDKELTVVSISYKKSTEVNQTVDSKGNTSSNASDKNEASAASSKGSQPVAADKATTKNVANGTNQQRLPQAGTKGTKALTLAGAGSLTLGVIGAFVKRKFGL